ncbi:MAG: IS1182 family transposase [Phycisphaerae bacterium]
MDDKTLPGMEHVTGAGKGGSGVSDADHQDPAAARVISPERSRVQMRCCSLDELVPLDHPARMVWQVTGNLDLSAFEAPIKAREGSAGRSAIDPRLLVALWLYATMDNVASGRKLAELCQSHVAYQWLCGEVNVNYHTLNDFRVGHAQALDALFTQVLGRLMNAGLVRVQRISQDGLRVRASAGSSSFKRQEKLESCLREAKEHLRDLDRLRDESPQQAEARSEALRIAAAEDRVRRINEAIAACQEQDTQKKARQSNPKKREAPSRGSTTDADARRMKMADGGFRPAYNLQVASDTESRAIVAVQATNSGGDALLLEPMRREIERRTGQTPVEQLADGGYVSLNNVDQAAQEQVTLYMPVPEPQKEGQNPFEPRRGDSEAVAAWRTRMGEAQSQAIYQERMSTSETINADLRTWRALGKLAVRGLGKVQCLALWSALTYNLMHFAGAFLAG